ncbi:prevent-host-death protein [Methylobacterium sp. J-072]|uniref:type II toxin-antitoxin system Phd/YefM family antitoxin n=1 Tax=Methylobacterium sp. J-072 TaxID=2836651 RepID=UPI001FB9B0FE|nr:prevent-host-death protein [Methylobacterium sp. J-072]MCJ2094899.1 prevent-host-death protein [Methylobacterium sp. J-072]
MTTIALEKAASSLAELAARVEGGETIVLTRDGKPVLDLVPHRRTPGLDIEAGEAFLRARGITRSSGFIADDFDDPLPEDFLIQPLSGS